MLLCFIKFIFVSQTMFYYHPNSQSHQIDIPKIILSRKPHPAFSFPFCYVDTMTRREIEEPVVRLCPRDLRTTMFGTPYGMHVSVTQRNVLKDDHANAFLGRSHEVTAINIILPKSKHILFCKNQNVNLKDIFFKINHY